MYTISFVPRRFQSCRWNFLLNTSWFIESHIFFTICLSVCIWGVKSTLILLSQQKSHSNKRKTQRSLLSRTSNLSFSVTTENTTLLITLSYSTASISHPIPLTAPNRFSHLKLSVCNPSYLSPTVSWMYVDSWNSRRTVLNCPQLTPAIALSVVPTVFGYIN
jgi:hypothetical protein